ncbi:MAG: hypothetical protein KAS32_29775 [Candidatus Peribacteraceae bacterium]|nr:hypothetical protein [Candidatus Peribacteraceae bacterium]
MSGDCDICGSYEGHVEYGCEYATVIETERLNKLQAVVDKAKIVVDGYDPLTYEEKVNSLDIDNLQQALKELDVK